MNNEEEIITRIKRFVNKEEGAYATGEDIRTLLKLYEDKKEEMYAIARANYILGQTDERSQWYKKINEKIEKIKKETWYISDGYEAKQSCIEELEELIGKEE